MESSRLAPFVQSSSALWTARYSDIPKKTADAALLLAHDVLGLLFGTTGQSGRSN
jgi:hypothetical protein